MTAVQIIELLSDVYIVLAFSFVLLFALVVAVKYVITGKGIEEPEEEDPIMEKLDKLQKALDCLASKHLDAKAMKEIQGVSEENKNECKLHIPSGERPFNEEDFEAWTGMFNSGLDRLIVEFSKDLNKAYSKMPDDDDTRHERKRLKLEQNIEYYRFLIALLSFIQSHGFEAFEVYLRRMCFMPANEETIERNNIITPEEIKMQQHQYEAPEVVELIENSEQNDELS